MPKISKKNVFFLIRVTYRKYLAYAYLCHLFVLQKLNKFEAVLRVYIHTVTIGESLLLVFFYITVYNNKVKTIKIMKYLLPLP